MRGWWNEQSLNEAIRAKNTWKWCCQHVMKHLLASMVNGSQESQLARAQNAALTVLCIFICCLFCILCLSCNSLRMWTLNGKTLIFHAIHWSWKTLYLTNGQGQYAPHNWTIMGSCPLPPGYWRFRRDAKRCKGQHTQNNTKYGQHVAKPHNFDYILSFPVFFLSFLSFRTSAKPLAAWWQLRMVSPKS